MEMDGVRTIIYLLAAYGAAVILTAVIRRIKTYRRTYRPEPLHLSLLMVIRDTEAEIEQVVRFLRDLQYYGDTVFPNFEVVVVDNGSQDQTPEIVQRLGEEYHFLRVVRITDKPADGYLPYETGLNCCRGEVVCLFDCQHRLKLVDVERAVTHLLGTPK